MTRFFKQIAVFALFIAIITVVKFSNVNESVDASIFSAVPTPRFIEVVSGATPYVTGLTASGTEVMIYIDDVFAGMARQTRIENEKEYAFYYQITSNLLPGSHMVTMLAREKGTTKRSEISAARELITPKLLAPKVTAPSLKTPTADPRPTIEGWTLNNTLVHIYIDGQYNGKTGVAVDPTGSAHFSYKPYLNLSMGWHTVFAIAEDARGNKSLASQAISFQVESPMSAPTLLKVKAVESHTQPRVTGLSKNGSTVTIYVDKKAVTSFAVKNHVSGTASFSEKLPNKLSVGQHLIYATAKDSRGKESIWSNLVYYTVPAVQPKITPVAATETPRQPVLPAVSQRVDTDGDGLFDYDETNKYKTDPKISDTDKDSLDDYVEALIYRTNPLKSDTDSDGFADKTEIDNGYSPHIIASLDSKRILAANKIEADKKAAAEAEAAKKAAEEKAKAEVAKQAEKATGTEPVWPDESTSSAGSILDDIGSGSESPEADGLETDNQAGNGQAESASSTEDSGLSRFQLNLIIFVVFLAGIIVWVIWVNREIIKERKKNNGDDSDKIE